MSNKRCKVKELQVNLFPYVLIDFPIQLGREEDTARSW